MPSRSDRVLLMRRLVAKLTGARRGPLKVPDHFPEVVKRLSRLTKSQLRDTVYWCHTNERTDYSLNQRLISYIRQVQPGGCIRTVNRNLSVHLRQSELVKPLPVSDWPRLGTRAAWPSTPTLIESLEMGRRGLAPEPIKTVREPVKYRITRAHFNSDVGMRARLISHQIVGIRSDIEVPKKFLGYFSYRWEFLILSVRHNLPAGLVRFLTGQWIRNPHNLWLREKYSFKNFLKKTDHRAFGSQIPGPW